MMLERKALFSPPFWNPTTNQRQHLINASLVLSQSSRVNTFSLLLATRGNHMNCCCHCSFLASLSPREDLNALRFYSIAGCPGFVFTYGLRAKLLLGIITYKNMKFQVKKQP
jgi:hypothetical protein